MDALVNFDDFAVRRHLFGEEAGADEPEYWADWLVVWSFACSLDDGFMVLLGETYRCRRRQR